MPEADPPPPPERSLPLELVPEDLATPRAGDETDIISTPAGGPGRGRYSGSGAGPASGLSPRSGENPQPDQRALPNLGEKIDEFRLVESIGAGGMGAVFRAVDVGLDRQVALKILPPEQAVDPEVVRRYHQEGRAAARLDHENIARVYTIGDDGRYHYIAFEYIEGITIRQKVIRDGPLAVTDAIHYTLQIAHALIHAAEREVIHRDIKPSNIILTPGGRAKLVDMGLARQFERGGGADLTQTGMTLGTFDYISPEQARDPRDVDIRGDLYSLGCTLFHMLSGRPPFPEGTVLQKLIQHREEAPPDIRRLNPKVPDSLALILGKLLVKDREHRYQTPEHLARDLRRVSARRTINLPAARETPNWARHLFWGAPGLSFLLVLAGMVWWGDGPRPPAPTGRGGPSRVPDTVAPVPFAPETFPLRSSGEGSAVARVPTPPVEPVAPREKAVSPGDDLARILAEAPPKSTILLVERGPYELRADRPIRLDRGDLTIRGEAGIRPVIRIVRDLSPTSLPRLPTPPTAALIDIRGGRVTFEGLDFLVDPASFEAAFGRDRSVAAPGQRVMAAISAEDAEVSIRRCSFRRVAGSGAGSTPNQGWRAAAIRFHGSPRSGPSLGVADPPVATLVVDASDFDGHQVGLLVSGPVDVSLRDVAFGPGLADQATIWADNPDAASFPAEFRLDHVSGLLGAGPMFRFHGATPRVIARHSVFGPVPAGAAIEPSPPTTTLVAIDHPDRLDWRGADNVYARLAVYLRPDSGRPLMPIRTFGAWADDPATFRESGSDAYESSLWERLPITSVNMASPESPRSFRMVLPRAIVQHPGARWGPVGPLPTPVWLASAGAANRTIPADPTSAAADRSPVAPAPAPPPAPVTKRPAFGADAREEPVDEMPADLTPMPMPTDPERPPIEAPEPTTAAPAAPAPIRSSARFLEALRRDEPGPRTLLLAADADLELPSGRIAGPSRWTIRGERGATRPRIRFRADAPDSVATESGWSAWLVIRSGGLRLEGVDLILPPAGLNRTRAAFAVGAGAGELVLADCTVTVEGDEVRSAVVAVLAGDPPVLATNPFDHLFAAPRRREPTAAAPRVQFLDCLLRSAGDLVDVASGRSVDLDLDNSVVATAGVLVHGHGREDGREPGALRVNLRRIAARLSDGLIHLETDRDRPNLPVASIQAGDSILALDDHPETPLIRVDGQGDLAPLRDRVTWRGRSVAYHRIELYRRDATSRPGVVPARVDRDSWAAAPGAGGEDEGAIRGDLGFVAETGLAGPAWAIRAGDWKLRPSSPAADAAIGPDLSRIPSPSS